MMTDDLIAWKLGRATVEFAHRLMREQPEKWAQIQAEARKLADAEKEVKAG